MWSLSDEEKRVFVKSMVDCVKLVEKTTGKLKKISDYEIFSKGRRRERKSL